MKLNKTLAIDRDAGGIDNIIQWAQDRAAENTPFAAILFPDGTRGSEKARKVAVEKLLTRAEDSQRQTVAEIGEFLMPPKSGGLWALRNAVPHARFLLISIAHEDRIETIPQLIRSHGTTIHIRISEYTDLPSDYKEMQVRLLDIWHDDLLPYYRKISNV